MRDKRLQTRSDTIPSQQIYCSASSTFIASLQVGRNAQQSSRRLPQAEHSLQQLLANALSLLGQAANLGRILIDRSGLPSKASCGRTSHRGRCGSRCAATVQELVPDEGAHRELAFVGSNSRTRLGHAPHRHEQLDVHIGSVATTGQCLLTASPARPCVPSPCPGRRRSRATGTPGSPGRGRPPPARHAAPSCRRADSPGSKACRRCRPA